MLAQIKPLFFKVNMLVYNPRILVNEVVFKRDPKEGRYYSESRLKWVPLEDIDTFVDGEIALANGTILYVEEDNEQINDLIIEKLKEAERYAKEQRMIEKMGAEPPDEVEA